MIAVQETTVWKSDIQPNHIYLLDGSKIVSYIPKGTNKIITLNKPLKIDRAGRTFIELKDSPFNVKVKTSVVEVKGSKGDTYFVDSEQKTCTCTGFQYRGRCKHIEQVCNG